jgi:hypothetical protein
MRRFSFLLLALAGISSLLSTGCRKDEFSDDPSAKLEFSTDTVMFDTVFTTVGSATEVFTVYNSQNSPVKVSSIRIAGGTANGFRLNVDGVPGNSFTDVEIGANDSIFIFAEVTVDPNSQATPLVVSDSILFETNGNLQKVQLVAWGQDAYFHRPAPNTPPLFFLGCGETWSNDKPHVVYGYALVDSGCALNIAAGTNIHFHPGSGIIVLSSGTLNVNGTSAAPVVFQGDRLGVDFEEIAGQWDRIWLSNITRSNLVNGSNEIGPGSRNSVIRNAVIKNGTIGLLVDTVFSPGQTTLRLENTRIQSMSFNGMICRGSSVKAFNCVFADCAAQTANLLYGGNYDFYQCTFANYWNDGGRQDPAVSFNNYFDVNVRRLDAAFYNCIVHGNLETEIGVDSFPRAAPGQCNFLFDHSLIKVENSYATSNTAFFRSILRATGSANDPGFDDPLKNIYYPDSAAAVIDAADPSVLSIDPILGMDITGQSRPLGAAPDMGAYERR